MKILIQNPFSKLYQGEGDSVYVTTISGDAEILPGHSLFSSIITGKVRVKDGKVLKFELDLGDKKGILHTDGKEVVILVT